MANISIIDILKAKKSSIDEFNFDNLWIPPMNCFISQQDVDALRTIATSVRLSSKIQEKYRMIDNIMKARGFRRFAAGTNRIVYKFMEDDRFLVKIAVDRVGMKDNPAEFNNQFLLKPFVSKMFYTSSCGTVGFVERVLPIKNKEEFKIIADDVFDMLVTKILGKYVVEDIGTKYFMNYGIRVGFGPVLLDYPYIFRLDGNKLFCSSQLNDGSICNGEIDYNSGFNHLVCNKCGKHYLARDLKEESAAKIIVSGGTRMKVEIVKGDQVLYRSGVSSQDVIKREAPKNDSKKKGFSVVITRGNEILASSETVKQPKSTKKSAASKPKSSAKKKIDETVSKPEVDANLSDVKVDISDSGDICCPPVVPSKFISAEETNSQVNTPVITSKNSNSPKRKIKIVPLTAEEDITGVE